ncbi:MAG: D-xylose ABC transporter ATP-binding protein [Spirochaetes bacterium]|nr:MAG: D-xylose ABC transporter ATP-binding protein [Spirochaetota bacterium]
MPEIILEARNIVKTFPGVKALDGVSLKLRKGEVHALVGENGAGKSTLMLTLGGIYRPDEGEIFVEGEEVKFDSPHDANKKGISVVFQELSLVPTMSIAENIFANRQPVKALNMVNWKKMHEDTRELLALFNLEHLDPSTPVNRLSIAMQQVVEILKAISFNPSVLVLDEPTSSLTENEVEQLFDNIRKLKDRGLSFIYISHHLKEIFEIADTVTVLRDGMRVCDADVSTIDEDFLITNMVGRSIENMYGQRGDVPIGKKVILEVDNLSRKGVFEDISFSVKEGEIVGLAGLVGAGRTELGRSIFGAEPADSGAIRLGNEHIAPRSPLDAINAGIGYLTEDRKTQGLILDFSIRDNLVSNHLRDFTSVLGFLNEGAITKFAEKSRDDYRIATPHLGQKIRKLSGGNQQKVLVGTWVGVGPKLLIMDEPTRGVDVGAKSDIYRLMRELAGKGVAILMISSDLPEILGMSDRVLVMQGGHLVGAIPGNEATEENVIALAAGTIEGEVNK